MKYGTDILCKVISGLVMQGEMTKEEKTKFLKAWNSASEDTKDNLSLKKEIMMELRCRNRNKAWEKEINRFLSVEL